MQHTMYKLRIGPLCTNKREHIKEKRERESTTTTKIAVGVPAAAVAVSLTLFFKQGLQSATTDQLI